MFRHIHICAVILLLCISFVVGAHFEYPNLEENEAFPHWGGLCDSGRKQSPIDLSTEGILKGEFGNLVFESYHVAHKEPYIVNNEHSVQIYKLPKTIKLRGGPLSDTAYVVEQLHFHWWSEHTINKMRYPLECHIVHRNERYNNFEEAVKYADGIVVVSTLFHVSNRRNEGIEDILKYLDQIKLPEEVHKPVKMQNFMLSNIIPTFHRYFTYVGSLTTPSCAESVTWIVFYETMPVTLKQIEKFREVQDSNGKHITNNYRFLQDNHNRPVVSVVEPSSSSKLNSIMSLSAILSIAVSSILV